MGARRLDDRDEAQFLVSRHAIDGADHAVANVKRSVREAEATLRDGVKRVEQTLDALSALDARILEAHEYLDRAQNGWKEQRRGVIMALHAARDHAAALAGREITDDEDEI